MCLHLQAVDTAQWAYALAMLLHVTARDENAVHAAAAAAAAPQPQLADVLANATAAAAEAVLAEHPLTRGCTPLSRQLALLPPCQRNAICAATACKLTGGDSALARTEPTAVHLSPQNCDACIAALQRLCGDANLRALRLGTAHEMVEGLGATPLGRRKVVHKCSTWQRTSGDWQERTQGLMRAVDQCTTRLTRLDMHMPTVLMCEWMRNLPLRALRELRIEHTDTFGQSESAVLNQVRLIQEARRLTFLSVTGCDNEHNGAHVRGALRGLKHLQAFRYEQRCHFERLGGLGVSAARQFIEAAAAVPTLRKLHLHSMAPDDIAQMLRTCASQLTSLAALHVCGCSSPGNDNTFAYCNVGSGAWTSKLEGLISAVPPSVTALHLEDNKIGADIVVTVQNMRQHRSWRSTSLASFAARLATHTQLQSLSMAGNRLTANHMPELGPALRALTALQSLNLSGSDVSAKDSHAEKAAAQEAEEQHDAAEDPGEDAYTWPYSWEHAAWGADGLLSALLALSQLTSLDVSNVTKLWQIEHVLAQLPALRRLGMHCGSTGASNMCRNMPAVCASLSALTNVTWLLLLGPADAPDPDQYNCEVIDALTPEWVSSISGVGLLAAASAMPSLVHLGICDFELFEDDFRYQRSDSDAEGDK